MLLPNGSPSQSHSKHMLYFDQTHSWEKNENPTKIKNRFTSPENENKTPMMRPTITHRWKTDGRYELVHHPPSPNPHFTTNLHRNQGSPFKSQVRGRRPYDDVRPAAPPPRRRIAQTWTGLLGNRALEIGQGCGDSELICSCWDEW